MILAAQYAREHHTPYLGICLGMQIAAIEFARHVLGITDANSGEFDPECPHKVIDFMPGQSEAINKGGTLRLGSYPCVVAAGTTMARCYGSPQIRERHRHRYEFNNDYRDALRAAGLTMSGLSPDGQLVEAVELSDRPFYVGVQYHPEFKSRPNRPHPLFRDSLQPHWRDRTNPLGGTAKNTAALPPLNIEILGEPTKKDTLFSVPFFV